MLPLRFQIISVAQHSRGAIEGVQSGEFRPPSFKTPYDYAGLQGLIAQTQEALSAWTPDAVNALGGRDVVFNLGEHKLPFTAEGFLMSFSLPTAISTPPPPTTSCAPTAFPWASGISWAG